MTRLDPGIDAGEDLQQEAVRPGRRRDASRDTEILAAALDVLAEVGYERMTMDQVAARARAGKATVYRRWSSKADLVVDAIACMKAPEAADVPDTGSLRGDLLAQTGRRGVLADAERKLRLMSAVASMLAHDPDLADAVEQVMVEPRARLYRELILRAEARGEIPRGADVDTIAHIVPSMLTYRMLVQRKSVDRSFVVGLIDGVVLPALGARSS